MGSEEEGRQARRRATSPKDERDYYLERRYPSFGNLAPRDIASRAAKEVCDEGRGVGPGGQGVYLDFGGRDPPAGSGARSAKNTATSLTCMRKSPEKTLTKSPCGFIPRRITRWAVCGSITI